MFSFLPSLPTLFNSEIWFAVTFIIFLIAMLIIESDREYVWGGVVVLIVYTTINFIWGSMGINFNWLSIPIYLGIGLIYSFIRIYLKGLELKKKRKDGYGGSYTVPNYKKEKMRDDILKWWLLVPFSLINWVFGKLISQFFTYLYKKSSRLYDYILGLGLGDIKDENKKLGN